MEWRDQGIVLAVRPPLETAQHAARRDLRIGNALRSLVGALTCRLRQMIDFLELVSHDVECLDLLRFVLPGTALVVMDEKVFECLLTER